LAAFGGDPLFFVVALAVGTGARINELLALEWSAVDWDLKTMRIDAALKPTAGLRFHDLRHTHATLLLQAGVPVAAVSARLGHANAAVTLGIYSHATTDAEAAAAQVAGSLLSSALKGG
jgi:integrase